MSVLRALAKPARPLEGAAGRQHGTRMSTRPSTDRREAHASAICTGSQAL